MIKNYIIEGTAYKYKDGIYTILDNVFELKLRGFLSGFKIITDSVTQPTISEYERLPFVDTANVNPEWYWRQQTLKSVLNEISEFKKCRILELGPYNNWLTHRLYALGHEVVCVDYFDNEFYGLRSKFNYRSHPWLSIQCDIEEPGFFKPVFDVIIVNHCVQFFTNPHNLIGKLKTLIKPKGKLLLTGLSLFKDAGEKEVEIENFKEKFRREKNFEIFLKPTKAHLNWNDRNELIDSNISLISQSGFFTNNLLAKFNNKRPFMVYGVWKNDFS